MDIKTPNAPCVKSAKQAINDKLQGSVATHLKCDGDVNNQINKRFIAESLSEKTPGQHC